MSKKFKLTEAQFEKFVKYIKEDYNEYLGEDKKRYIITSEFFIYAKDDNNAKAIAQAYCNNMNKQYDNDCTIVGINQQTAGTMGSREIDETTSETKKYKLYRKPSNSPSPGHGYYLFTHGDTLDELFNNWIIEMKRGGYGLTPEWIKDQTESFAKDKENYFVNGRGSMFYSLTNPENEPDYNNDNEGDDEDETIDDINTTIKNDSNDDSYDINRNPIRSNY